MGFFKKFFSIGSKKSKKRLAVDSARAESLPLVQEHFRPTQIDNTEEAVSRLLRSSSSRFVAEPQTSLNSLPPLPHPIDSVVPLPKSSSTTIASVSARSTYSVTIHSRTVHSRTEFPNAYPSMDVTFTPKRSLTDSSRRRSKSVPITPRDKSRLLLLRQDPSVASLLNHYDDEGHLDSLLFSNTPSPRKEGRVQRHPTGSTLRQLLGHPSLPELRNTSTEGDISWAEKFLGETDDNSSVSSTGPQTPADTHFADTLSINNKTALSIECDTSSANQQTFSSLEVELSVSTDFVPSQAPSSPQGNSTTPKRASQVFGFLGDKKRVHDGVSRLPQLKAASPHYRRFSAESSISDTRRSHIPLPRRSSTYLPQPTSPNIQRRFSLSSDANRSPPSSPTAAVFLSPQPEDEESMFSQAVISQRTGQNNRSPYGPRSPSIIHSRQSTSPSSALCASDSPHSITEQPLSEQSVLSEKSNTDNKYINVAASRPRETHSQIPKLRTPSGSSSSSVGSRHEPVVYSPHQHPLCLQPGVWVRPKPIEAEQPTSMAPHGKENDSLSRLPQPITPVRPFGLYSHHLREPPSPTSSSELSPVAKQMMASLREQRMHARQRERQAGRVSSSQSRIRHD